MSQAARFWLSRLTKRSLTDGQLHLHNAAFILDVTQYFPRDRWLDNSNFFVHRMRRKRSTSMFSSLTNTRLQLSPRLYLSNLAAVAAASRLVFFWSLSLIWYANSSMLVFSRFLYSQFSHTQSLRVGHCGLLTCYVLKLDIALAKCQRVTIKNKYCIVNTFVLGPS